MKLLKFIPMLLILTFISSNVFAAKDCNEIKGNIVGKMFCKAKSGSSTSLGKMIDNSDSSSSAGDDGGWKIWKKPEWMKKKN